jgi:hypothetical protein
LAALAVALRSQDDVEVSLRHLRSLEFFDRIPVGEGDWGLNAVGRQFLCACYPEVERQ